MKRTLAGGEFCHNTLVCTNSDLSDILVRARSACQFCKDTAITPALYPELLRTVASLSIIEQETANWTDCCVLITGHFNADVVSIAGMHANSVGTASSGSCGSVRLLNSISCQPNKMCFAWCRGSIRLPNGGLSPAAFSPIPRSAAAAALQLPTGSALLLPSKEPQLHFDLLWEQDIASGGSNACDTRNTSKHHRGSQNKPILLT